MNTLKIKVLLVLINRTLWNRIGRSLLIWLSTCMVGSFFLWTSKIIGLDLAFIFLLSLTFSLPVLLFLVPNLYFLDSIIGRAYRITYAFASTMVLCLLVALLFLKITKGYPLEQNQLMGILLPFMVSAEVSFFFFAYKTITGKK